MNIIVTTTTASDVDLTKITNKHSYIRSYEIFRSWYILPFGMQTYLYLKKYITVDNENPVLGFL